MSKPKPDESTAEALLRFAQQYHRAATILTPHANDVEAPVYYLYVHAMELALKAFLRSHGLPAPRGTTGHDIKALLESCKQKGLQTDRNLENVVSLLEPENREYGFRYFAFKSTTRPALNYLKDVVDALILAIADEVSLRPSKTPSAAVMKWTVGKPVKK